MKLSIWQIVVLWLGVGAIVVMCLFPPWRRPMDAKGGMYEVAGYHFIGIGPYHLYGGDPERPVVEITQIDYERLALQCATVVIIVAGAIFIPKTRISG